MSVIQSIQNIFSGIRIKPVESSLPAIAAITPPDVDTQTDLRRARSSLLKLYEALESLADLANIKTRVKLDLPDAESGSGLGLDLTHTASTLASSEEINASPMSFTPFGPDWDLGSSALLTIGGEYDGTHGSGNISFESRRAGTHGVDNLQIRVRDPLSNIIGNFNIQRNDPLDQQYDLQNGLFFTLGPNSLIDNDTTTIQVFDSVGAAVDPTKPLGGIRNSNPNLQFGGPSITNGSFTVNGENISVSTSDSINDVVNRINQSAGGVTASFNAVTEQIEFLQDTLGSVPTIDLQNDTSNFLLATKLDSVNVVPGIDPETIKTFENVAAFSTVQAGNIVINGKQIAIDSATDSLTTMIDKINASSAGVVASFDPTDQTVLIEAVDSSSSLNIDSNGTGFFAALNMPEGRVDPEAISGGISRRRSYDIADSFSDIFAELNYLFLDTSFVGKGQNSGSFRTPFESAVNIVFGDDAGGEAFGIEFDNSDNARQRGDFATLDRRDLTTNLQRRGDAVIDFLSDNQADVGLLGNLLKSTLDALQNVNSLLGQSGTFIDTFA